MPRRARFTIRKPVPDAQYQSELVTTLINKMMLRGQKATSEKIVYGALRNVEQKAGQTPLSVLEMAIKKATPLLQVKPRRVGGATYQVPVEVEPGRGRSLAIRWLVKSARARGGKSMQDNLAAEILDASQDQGATVKKREDTHKMAEANRAFAHYRW
ncbi:MAG: 30S ribosomal protein S7 [Chloroflexota bacterium]